MTMAGMPEGTRGGRRQGGRIVLTTESFAPGAGTYYEHFIYERISDTQFRMSYETSRDAITWRLGDSLIFNKKG